MYIYVCVCEFVYAPKLRSFVKYFHQDWRCGFHFNISMCEWLYVFVCMYVCMYMYFYVLQNSIFSQSNVLQPSSLVNLNFLWFQNHFSCFTVVIIITATNAFHYRRGNLRTFIILNFPKQYSQLWSA